MKIRLDGVGYRNTENESDQIIWFWTQKAKTLSAAQRTAFFLTLKERLSQALVDCQAFEVLDFINKQVTTEQERRRQRSKARAKIVANLEMEEIEKRAAYFKAKDHFLGLIKMYNTPN